MKKLLLVLISLQLALCGYSQPFDSIYKLNKKVDIPLATVSVAWAGGVSAYGKFWLPLPTKESIANLNHNGINAFDRGATYQNSKGAKYASDVLLYASIGTPLIYLADKNMRKDFWKLLVMNGEAIALNVAITGTFKIAVQRKRPLMYNPNVSTDDKYKRDNFQSFFSGHTSLVATESFFFAKTFADCHPNSKLKPLVWALCAALPAGTAVLRYEAGKHYWTDVMAGYAVGTLIGVGVPYIHQAIRKRYHRFKGL